MIQKSRFLKYLPEDKTELGHERHFKVYREFIYGYMEELEQYKTESLSFRNQTDLGLSFDSLTTGELLGKLSYYSGMEFHNL